VIGGIMLPLAATDEPARASSDSSGLSEGFYAGTLGLWTMLALYLVHARATMRCGSLEMTLPLAARDLWLARMGAIALSTAVLLAAGCAVALIRNVLRGAAPTLPPPAIEICINQWAVILLALAAVQIRDRSLARVEIHIESVVFFALVWICGLALLLVLPTQPPHVVWIVFILAVSLHGWVFRSLPAAFAAVPAEAAPVPLAELPALSDRLPAPKDAARGLIALTVLRALHWHGFVLFIALLLLLTCVRQVGYWIDGLNDLVRLPQVWVLLTAFLTGGMLRLRLIDYLPIRRRFVFACLVLPGVFLAVAGILIGSLSAWIEAGGRPLAVCVQPVPPGERRDPESSWEGDSPVAGASFVRVPFRFWEVSGPGGQAAVLDAPWGEIHPAPQIQVTDGGRLAIYEPYAAPLGCSPQFVAQQLARAIEKIYGTAIPPAELQRRYIDTLADGSAHIAPGSFTLLEDYPHLRARDLSRRLPLTILAGLLPWFLAMAMTLRRFFGNVSLSLKAWFPPLAALFMALAWLPEVWVSATGFTDRWALAAVTNIQMRLLCEWIPGGALVLWGLTVILLLIGYRLAERQFRWIETPRDYRAD
jgi:hypothetical protein